MPDMQLADQAQALITAIEMDHETNAANIRYQTQQFIGYLGGQFWMTDKLTAPQFNLYITALVAKSLALRL